MNRLCACLLLFATACSGTREANAAGEVTTSATTRPARPIANRDTPAQTDELAQAATLIEQHHPWRATQLLAPLLRDPQKRTPDVLLMAARAAAGWGGWAEVDKLVGVESWIDVRFDGEARELLTRSALERSADTASLTQATIALRDATKPDSRAARTVYLARALERNNFFDSAAVLYLRARDAFPLVRDWLALRAAGSQSDSAKRANAFALVTSAAAKPRIPWTDALARERFRDALGAAARYASVGATVPALRLRLSVAPDTGTRDAIKRELLAFIRGHPGSADGRAAVEVLDKGGFASLPPSEEIVVARSAGASGPPARAIAAFERALTQPSLITAADRIEYAQALARAGRSHDAAAQLDTVEGPLAGQAAYQRARLTLASGPGDATRAALRDVATRFPADTSAASAALYLLADLTTDDGNDDQARALYRQVYERYPTSVRAANARFAAAVLAFVKGEDKVAAQEFDSLSTTRPKSDDAVAARYWSGRAWAAAGNQTLARQRWREVAAQQPPSYYALASARRLGEKPWTPPIAGLDSFPAVSAVDSAMSRAALLERLGMDAEVRFEYDALEETAAASPARVLATAHAFLEHGQPSRAIRLAQRLIDTGQRDARTYRLLFPILDRDELARDAKAHGLDPALVAGIIRQESSFNARAVSVAGARGLMQVLPAVGEEVSRSLAYPVWYPSLLFDPDANLQLGTAHLAGFVKQYGAIPRVLAAYNAGGSRAARWQTRAGVDDPELFAERIPFVETRDYVRIVIRNAEVYKTLYGW